MSCTAPIRDVLLCSPHLPLVEVLFSNVLFILIKQNEDDELEMRNCAQTCPVPLYFLGETLNSVLQRLVFIMEIAQKYSKMNITGNIQNVNPLNSNFFF